MALHRTDPLTTQDEPDLAPLRASHEANQLETELKALFMDMLAEFIRPGEREVNTLGAPHLGPFSQVERAVKHEGLALYRRAEESDMRYLFRAWRARNPKRGTHVLRCYLQLLWPNGWTVDQLYQPLASPYPQQLASMAGPDRFLTSRVRVGINTQTSDGQDVLAALPALRSVVPARILLQFVMLTATESAVALTAVAYRGFNRHSFTGTFV